MKKILIVLCSVITAVAITGCNVQIPQSVSIKTDAKYKFTAAEIQKDLSDFSPVDSLVGSALTGPYEMYKYNPGGNSEKQQLMLVMDMQGVPIDMNQYLDDTALSLASGMSIEKNITIPDVVDISNSQKINFTDLSDKINEMVIITGSSEGSLSFSFDPVTDSFETIEYESGYLEVEGQMGIKLSGTISLNDNGVVVTSGTFENNKAIIPLTGVTLKKDNMSIDFSDYTGGDFTPYLGKIRKGSKIKQVTGLTVAEPQTFPITIDPITFGNSSDLKSCVIDEGEISVTFDSKTWSKGIITYDIEMTGGLNDTIHGDDTGKVSEDLHDIVITNADIIPNVNVSLFLSNSTLTFDIEPEFTFEVSVKKIASATVGLPEDFRTNYDIEQILPGSITSILKEVRWNNSGIRLTGTNTLPPSNDIGFTVASAYFEIPSTSKILAGGESNKKLEFLGDYSGKTGGVLARNTSSNKKIDLNVDLTLPGYNSVENTITLTDIVPGSTYKLAMTVEPVFDWNSDIIDSAFTEQKGNFATNINLSSMFGALTSVFGDDISDKIALSQCNVLLFCDIPSLSELNNSRFTGEIKLGIGKESGGNISFNETAVTPMYLLGSDSGEGSMPSKPCPKMDIDFVQHNDITIPTVKTDLAAAYGEPAIDISGIINAKAAEDECMCLEYDIKFESGEAGEIEISKEALRKSEVKSIRLTAAIIIPVAFKLSEDISLDVMKLVKKDEWTDGADLMGRTEAPDNSTVEDYLEMIKSVSIEYATSTIPFVTSKDLSLGIDLDGDGTEFDKHILTLKSGSITENPAKVMSVYPLHPAITLELPGNTEIALPTDMSIKINIKLAIATNGDKELNLWKNGGND